MYVCCVYFFKQKTAYEMRISDWSSDVCSSDLASIAGPGFINLRLTDATWRAELAAIHAEAEDYGRSSTGAGVTVNVEYVSANPTGPMHMGHCRGAVVGEIGRASCRERVCQYVSISGVAVSLKKKDYNNDKCHAKKKYYKHQINVHR